MLLTTWAGKEFLLLLITLLDLGHRVASVGGGQGSPLTATTSSSCLNRAQLGPSVKLVACLRKGEIFHDSEEEKVPETVLQTPGSEKKRE